MFDSIYAPLCSVFQFCKELHYLCLLVENPISFHLLLTGLTLSGMTTFAIDHHVRFFPERGFITLDWSPAPLLHVQGVFILLSPPLCQAALALPSRNHAIHSITVLSKLLSKVLWCLTWPKYDAGPWRCLISSGVQILYDITILHLLPPKYF